MKKRIETIKKNQLEMSNTITEVKNKLEGTNSRLDKADDKITDLENKVPENT